MSSTIVHIGIAILAFFFLVFILGYAIKNKRDDEDLFDPTFRLLKALIILAAYIGGFLYLIYGAWVAFSELKSMRYESIICITWFGLLTLVVTALFTRIYLSGSFTQELSSLKKRLAAQEEQIKTLEKTASKKK